MAYSGPNHSMDDDPANALKDYYNLDYDYSSGKLVMLLDADDCTSNLFDCTLKPVLDADVPLLNSRTTPLGATASLALNESIYARSGPQVKEYIDKSQHWIKSVTETPSKKNKSSPLKGHSIVSYMFTYKDQEYNLPLPKEEYVERRIERIQKLTNQATSEFAFAYKLAFDEPATQHTLSEIINKTPQLNRYPNGKKYREYLNKVSVFIVLLTEVAVIQEWMKKEMTKDFNFWKTEEGDIVKEAKNPAPNWQLTSCMTGEIPPFINSAEDLLHLRDFTFCTKPAAWKSRVHLLLRYKEHAHNILTDPYAVFVKAIKYCCFTQHELFHFLFESAPNHSGVSNLKYCPCGQNIEVESNRTVLDHDCNIRTFLQSHVPQILDGNIVHKIPARRLQGREKKMFLNFLARRIPQYKWVKVGDKQLWMKLQIGETPKTLLSVPAKKSDSFKTPRYPTKRYDESSEDEESESSYSQ